MKSKTIFSAQVMFAATIAICVVTMPTWADTFTWTGGGANKNWSTAANWSPAGTMTASDTANFQTGTLSSDTITYDSGAFAGITVQSGAWTANVASASFTGKPITVSSGATFALKNAGSVTNPFSTTQNANAISGILDLGGATQTIADAMGGSNTGFFRNGGEIRNGTLTISGSRNANLVNTTFTIGPDANLTGAVRYYLYNGANLIIDGGSLSSTTTADNHPIGTSSGYAYVRVKNGGKFTVAKPVWLGFTARGFLIGDNGTIDLGSSDLYLSIRNNTTGVLALTNSTLTCGRILFGYSSSTYPTPNTQTLSMKDSVAFISKFVGVSQATASSSIRFDGAVLVPKAAATDFLPNSAILPTPTLGAGGLIVSNSYDVTIAKGLAGSGKLVKEGNATLTLTGAHTFTGGIDLRKGTLALDPNVSLANSTLTMSGGATLKLKFTPGVGFATSNLVAALDANTSGNVTIEIDTSDGLPEEDRPYTLFASGLDAAALGRISVFPAIYALAVADGGAVTITLQRVPVTHVWTGGGADAKWTTSGNWDTDANFGAFDSVVFGGTGGYSIYDCGEVLITNVTVQSGAHTANVAQAGFSGFPVTVASGAEFALEGAAGATNPFSTEMNANAISGVLDLGGASQTITSVLNGTGAFRDGGEIRNGTVTLVPSSWGIYFDNTTFTVGNGADFSSGKRFYFQNGAHFKIDGGSFLNTDTAGNHVVGGEPSGSFATFEVSNGGRVTTQSGHLFIGHIANTSGTLIGDGGILDFGTATIFLCNSAGTKSTLALTNSVLSCGNIQFSYGTANAISNQTLVLNNTLVNLSSFVFRRKADDSSILFDGATLVPTGAAADFLPSGLPTPQLGAGGLVISNAFDVGVAVGMAGAGGLVKEGDGALTVSANQSFTGDVVVSGGSFTTSSTFAGGLRVASGATLDVANATFGGDIAIEGPIVTVATNGVNWESVKAVPVAKTTAAVVAFPGGHDADGRHFFVRRLEGKSVLYYGKQRGLMIMVR
jgi:autotransporter-associated beta strand protein